MDITSLDAVLYGASALGVIILGVALGYGIVANRHRNRANDAVSEKAAREMYKHPDTYDQRREDLKKQLR
jgi:hypothetical protein